MYLYFLIKCKKLFEALCSLIYLFLAAGKIGDWKNHFTVADNELFDSVLEKWTAGKEIPFIYE